MREFAGKCAMLRHFEVENAYKTLTPALCPGNQNEDGLLDEARSGVNNCHIASAGQINFRKSLNFACYRLQRARPRTSSMRSGQGVRSDSAKS
jgi:hypothetical protein